MDSITTSPSTCCSGAIAIGCGNAYEPSAPIWCTLPARDIWAFSERASPTTSMSRWWRHGTRMSTNSQAADLPGSCVIWPASWRNSMVDFAERKSLDLIMRFHSLAKLQFAPNPELVQLVAERTGGPAFPMQRGIDTALFNPCRRTRTDSDFVVGYVGRLSPEKNVRLLASLERFTGFRFLIVGDGSERKWLAANMKNVELPGVLQGVPLAEAYANMDAFVFPSETDTFGNVVLEALASGVPAVVSSGGGPKFLVEEGVTGFVASSEAQFLEAILKLKRNPDLRRDTRRSARQAALQRSWDAVFAGVYSRYGYLKTSFSTLPEDPLGGSVPSKAARVGAMSVTA